MPELKFDLTYKVSFIFELIKLKSLALKYWVLKLSISTKELKIGLSLSNLIFTFFAKKDSFLISGDLNVRIDFLGSLSNTPLKKLFEPNLRSG